MKLTEEQRELLLAYTITQYASAWLAARAVRHHDPDHLGTLTTTVHLAMALDRLLTAWARSHHHPVPVTPAQMQDELRRVRSWLTSRVEQIEVLTAELDLPN